MVDQGANVVQRIVRNSETSQASEERKDTRMERCSRSMREATKVS